MRSALLAIVLAGCTYGHKPDITGPDVDGSVVDPKGPLGPFSTIPDKLPIARVLHATVTADRSVYVIGGFTENTLTSDVERAIVGTDDVLMPFANAGTLVSPRAGHASIVLGSFIYVIGGFVDEQGMAVTSIERVTINPDGTLGSFSTLPIKLVRGRAGHTVEVVGSSLYVIGGSDGTVGDGSIERAQINPDNTIGNFAIVSGITEAVVGHTSHVIGNRLYVIGGADTTTVAQSTIIGGSIGPFAAAANVELTPARSSHTSVVYNDQILVVGGFNNASGPTTTVMQIPVAADGKLGTPAPTDVTENRFGHTTTRVGRYLYVIAGQDAVTQMPLPSIERAELH
jgi:Kelch motif protein